MRSKEAFESVREDGEISSTSEEAARIENPLLPVSQRCLELTLASLTKTESIAAEKEAARLAQEALRLNEEASRRAAAAAVSANLDSKMARQQQQGARGEGGRGGGARDRRAGSPSRERDALSRQPDRRGDRSPARDRNRGRSRDRDRDRGRSRDRYRERDRDRGLSRGRSPPYSRSRSRGASPLNSRAPSRSRNASSRDRGRERERDGNRDGTRDRSDRAHSGRIHSPDRRDRDPRGYAYDSRDIRRSPDRSRGYSRSRDRYEGGFQHSDNRYPGGDYYRYPVSRSPSRARYDDRAYGTAAVPAPIAAPVTANSRGRSRDRAQKDSGGDSGDRKGGKGGRDSRERRGGAGDAVNRASAVAAAAADASNAQQDRKRGRRSRSPDPRVDPHRQSGPTVRSPPEKEARPAKRARSFRPGGREQVEEGEEAEEGCEDGEEPLNTTTAHAESTFGSIYCRDVSQASQYPNPPYLGICETSPVLPPSLAPPPPPAVASGESGGVWRDLSPQTHNTGEYSTCGGDLSPNGGFTAAPSAVDLTCLPSSSSSSSSATSSTHQVVYSLVDTETLSAPLRSSMATAVHTMSVSEGAIKSTVDLLGPADLDNVIEMSSTTDLLVETIHAAEALAPSSEKSPAADLALSQAASVDPVGVVLPLALSVLQESNSSAEGVGTSVASAPAAGSEPSNLATRTSPRTRASPRTTSPRGTRTSPRGAGGNSSKVAIETAAPAPAAGGVLEDTCAPPPGLSPGLPSAALTAPASSAAASPSSRLPVLSPVPVASATATISPTNAANSSSTPSVAVAVPSAGPAAPARVVTISASSGANHDSIIEMRAARFASPAVVPAATVPTATSSVTGPTPPHLGTTANIAPPPTSAVPSSSGASGDREGASTSPTKDSGSRHNDGDNRRNTSDQRMDRRDDSSRDQRSSKKRRRGGGGSGSSESNSRSSPDGQGQQRGGNRRHGGGTGDTSNRNINYNNSTQQAQQRNQRNSPRNHQQQNQNQQHQGTPCLSPSQLQHNEHSKSNERGGKGARRRSNEDSQQLSPLQVNPHTTGANNRDTRPNRPPTVAAESKRDLMKLLASCTGAGGSGKRNTGVVGSAASNGRTAVLYPKKDTEGAARCSDKEKVVQSVEKMGFKNLVKLSSMK